MVDGYNTKTIILTNGFILFSFCFFDIKISALLRLLSISHEDKTWFLNEHFNLLQKTNIDISIDRDAPYQENQFLKIFKEGIEESNLEKIYQLVFSIERGRGFEFPYITKLVAKSLFELDFNLTFDLINQTESFIKTLFYCDSISFQSLLIPTIFKNEHNTWLLIEIVRNYASLKDQIYAEQAQLCSLLLKKLCHLNENIFWQFVKLYNNSANAIIILAETFLLVEDKYLFLYAELIKIDDYYSEEKSKAYNIFFDILFVPGKKNAAIKFGKIVYRKWLNFLDEYLLQEKYTNQIIQTIYDGIVLRFILKTFSPAELFREFNHNLNNIVNLRLQWHKGFQQYQKIYFMILSRLYLLSHFFKYNNKWYHLRNRINKKIEELLSNERVWLLFHDSIELPEVYKTIKKNLQPIRKRLNKK